MYAHKVFLYGRSGTGKTASLRNLDPKKTGIINMDRKSLPIQGWRQKYKTVIKTDERGVQVPDLDKSNYVEPKSPSSILKVLHTWDARKDIEYIILDTLTHLITADYMKNAIGKDYSSYQKMGLNVFHIFDFIRDMQTNVLVIAHTDTKYTDLGQKQVTMKSYGKMIENMAPPSFFTTVLITQVEDEGQGKRNYLFRTQSDGADDAKSPAYFDQDEATPALPFLMSNDANLVFKKLDAYEKGEEYQNA